MRRSPPTRAAATLLSLLFLLAWGEPVALHPCPMHDGHPAAAVGHDGGRATTPGASAGHDAHADHAAQGARMDAAAPAPDGPSHDGGTHVCQCLGHCCSATGVVLAPMQAVRWQVVVTRLVEPPAPEAATIALVATPHALPFANGPPSLA